MAQEELLKSLRHHQAVAWNDAEEVEEINETARVKAATLYGISEGFRRAADEIEASAVEATGASIGVPASSLDKD